MRTLHSFSAIAIDGRHVELSSYAGQVVLVVNVASHCGFTPQYRDLEALYRRFKDQGFVILGFPCNQFGGQEPADEAGIQAFCSLNYDVTFPLFSKIDVNGAKAHPLYAWLKEQQPGILGTRALKWNFTKFLVGRDGHVLKRYGSSTPPHALLDDIQAALAPHGAAGGGSLQDHASASSEHPKDSHD